MAAPPNKKSRKNDEHLVDLHRGSYLSQSALRYVLNNVKANGLPETFSRSQQGRANAMVGNTDTPYGPPCKHMTLPLVSGPVSVGVQNPCAMLWLAAHESAGFQELMHDTLRRYPCTRQSPWRLVIYFDGITPNNPLSKGKDNRKVDAFYWSFLEFGNFLSQEIVWFCCSATRHVLIEKLTGNMSENVMIVLGELFFGENDMARHGVTLDIGEHTHTIYAEHHITIADGLAIEEVSFNKGHAGTVPCAICRNVTDVRWGYHAASGGRFVPTTSLNPGEWKRHTDHSVRQLILRLQRKHADVAAGTLTQARFNDIQQMCGYNYNPKHIVLNDRLNYKAITTLFFDWMHIWCIDGVFLRQFEAFMDAIKIEGTPGKNPILTFAAGDRYLQYWTWPQQHASGKTVFETGSLQATASQTLSVAPVIGHLAREVLLKTGRCTGAVQSMISCCVVLEMLSGAMRGAQCVTADALDVAIRTHFQEHLDAFGDDWWAFKFHMALHIPGMFRQFGFLLACWVLERKHRMVKRFITDMKRLQGYEMHCMLEVTAQHLSDLRTWSPRASASLIDPRNAPSNVRDAIRRLLPNMVHHPRVSGGAMVNTRGSQCWRGDFALMDSSESHAAGDVFFTLTTTVFAIHCWLSMR